MDLKELEKDLDRQWEAAQLRAMKAIDEWIMTLPRARSFFIVMIQGVWEAVLVDRVNGSRIFRGTHPSDARAQAAQALISEGYAK